MKLSRSGENTLRVSLSGEELEGYDLTEKEFDYEHPEGKRVIREIFDKAKREMGFDVESKKVYVQLYPKKDGGCEIFVIRMEEEKRECYLFGNLEAFLKARALFEKKERILCYRRKKEERFLIFAPSVLVPPRLSEYGEKMKPVPSDALLSSRYIRISQ